MTQDLFGPGARLGPYIIEAPIGAGGMGQVFRATDSRLHRAVAIKILPSGRVADEDRKRRFMQEARAASALNHPNIITLYDIASDDGIDYMVMEYVPGKSLDKVIAPEGLPLAQVVDYGTQIAGALAAAHGTGIIHRDIKPANIMVTADGQGVEGQIKVLDFGLAKLEEPAPGPDDETRTLLTQAGTVMGTLAYMSPEQARAEPVDGRTDLFSFGAVLYEMATGQRAFRKSLDWSTPPVDALPAGLRPIVLKLLEVDQDLRYQAAGEVVEDLKRLQRSSASPRGLRRWWIATAAAVVVLVLAVVAILYLRPGRAAGRDQWVQLTRFPDSVSQPALSPDGKMLTFIRGPDTFEGPGQIYLKTLPNGEPVQLTHDSVNKMSPVFSPDGSSIAYTVGGWHTWVVPVVSGQPRLWMMNASGLVWFGKNLLFSELRNGQVNFMASVTSQENRAGQRDIYVPSSYSGMAHRTVPSPDGKSALIVEMDHGAWLPCRLVPLDGSSPGGPVGPPGRCTFAAWSPDGKWMYFSSSTGDSFHIWRQRARGGRPEQVTSGPAEEEGIAMDPNGRSFITAVAQRQSIVWVHEADGGERQISLEGYSIDPKFTSDGKYLCYRILKGGLTTNDPSELRLVELATGHSEPLLPGVEVVGNPGRAYDISPDGRALVAVARDAAGKFSLWVAALDRQSPPRQIQSAESRAVFFGKDNEIFFRASTDQAAGIAYAIRNDGTGLRKLSEQPVLSLVGLTQDDQSVVARVSDGKTISLAALSVKGGVAPQTVSLPSSSTVRLLWSADGKRLFVSLTSAATATHIVGRTWAVPLPAGKMFPAAAVRTRADFENIPGTQVIEAYDAAPAPSAGAYAFSRSSVQRNLFRIPIP